MSQPQISLPALSTTGSGNQLDNSSVLANHTLVTISSAGISAGAVQLQGSLDNLNWANLGTPITLTASTVQTVSVTGAPFRFVRANVSTNVTGGTVSAWVGSA
jgi:hypothetical protein